MFDVWPVYSGERFRASWPSCFKMPVLLPVLVYSDREVHELSERYLRSVSLISPQFHVDYDEKRKA